MKYAIKKKQELEIRQMKKIIQFRSGNRKKQITVYIFFFFREKKSESKK